MKSKNKVIYKIVLSLITIIIASLLAFYIYTLDYYRALPGATMELSKQNIVEDKTNDLITLKPQENPNKVGIIFYPGGKVEYLAYLPLLEKLTQNGYTSFLVKMPFNLAVFDKDAAKDIIKENESIDKWYLAGHSLGGSMASIYANENSEKIDGLILLASYPAADLSDKKLAMISIYGSNDGVLNIRELENKKVQAPESTSYSIIEGGNHAYFGNYGEQEGDGQASISVEEQQKIAVDKILEFLQNNQ